MFANSNNDIALKNAVKTRKARLLYAFSIRCAKEWPRQSISHFLFVFLFPNVQDCAGFLPIGQRQRKRNESNRSDKLPTKKTAFLWKYCPL